ncbi:MAG: glycosyl hydrolase 53 family protein [Bacteroidales bacterium]|nr:glycosyl hydrolase 53 family protein [Bacteroidales bacterium]
MRKSTFFSVILCFLLANITWAQTITLTFTGHDNKNEYVQLNRVVVTNYTQGWQETICWPDTSLSMEKTSGIEEYVENRGIVLSQNNPNPFIGTTDVCLTMADAGAVALDITDINGRVVWTMRTGALPMGSHCFRVSLAAAGNYLMTARLNGRMSSIKMVCSGGGGSNAIEYVGETQMMEQDLITTITKRVNVKDKMEYVGYATIDGIEVESRHIRQSQNSSQAIPLQFAGQPVFKSKSRVRSKVSNEDFRVALSLSPFSLNQFQKGYTFAIGDKTATTPEELQSIYWELGSTEMYVRIATKRHVTAEDITDGEPDENANVHTFDQGIHLCQIAAALDIPINPEIMCAYTYMDMDKQQAPRFDEYPEFNYLMNGKDWSELTLDEICTVLEAYGEFVASAILNTGCKVNNWNLGNEANFGFAGISMGLKTAVDPKLEKAGNLKKYTAPVFARGWLKKHVWKHDAKAYAAVKQGILNAYAKLGVDATNVKFSTHVATVVFPAGCTAKFFNFMKENGYEMETAGISYYPSAPSMSLNKKQLLKKTVKKVNKKCDLNVFIGEFSYPSGKMDGPFAGWNKKVRGYQHDQQGQADIYADVINWGKANGLIGIRYWAPDYEGWYAMSMFEFSNNTGTAKTILQNHKEIVGE